MSSFPSFQLEEDVYDRKMLECKTEETSVPKSWGDSCWLTRAIHMDCSVL